MIARTETLTFRLNEIAARKGIKLANDVERALAASLTEPMEFLGGASLRQRQTHSMTTMMPLAF